jgi:hypothetical protein
MNELANIPVAGSKSSGSEAAPFVIDPGRAKRQTMTVNSMCFGDGSYRCPEHKSRCRKPACSQTA